MVRLLSVQADELVLRMLMQPLRLVQGSLHQVRSATRRHSRHSGKRTQTDPSRPQYRIFIARIESGWPSGWRDDGSGKDKAGEANALKLSLPGHFVRCGAIYKAVAPISRQATDADPTLLARTDLGPPRGPNRLLHRVPDRTPQGAPPDANDRPKTVLGSDRLRKEDCRRKRMAGVVARVRRDLVVPEPYGHHVGSFPRHSSCRRGLSTTHWLRLHRFLSYELIQRAFKRYKPDMNPGTANFLSGGLASNAFWVSSFPFDAVKKCVAPVLSFSPERETSVLTALRPFAWDPSRNKQPVDDRLVDEPEIQVVDDVRGGHVGRRWREGEDFFCFPPCTEPPHSRLMHARRPFTTASPRRSCVLSRPSVQTRVYSSMAIAC